MLHLFIYFVLLSTARGYRLMPSGGDVFLGKKKLAISESYATITKPRRGEKYLVLGRGNGLTHIFDPCWMWVVDLTEEREYAAAPVMVSKTGVGKHPRNRGCAKVEILNLKWSWMCREPKSGGKSCLHGWSISRPHIWPMFWPIRDHHAVDWANFSGFMTSGFFAKKGKKRYCRNGKSHF